MAACASNGFVCVGLRRKWDEGHVGDLIDGLAAYFCDLLAGANRYKEERGCDFQQACETWPVSSLYA